MQLIKEKCQEVSEILCVKNDEALIILNHYKWRKDFIGEDWLQNEGKLRKDIGLEPEKEAATQQSLTEIYCLSCSTLKPKQDFESLSCNHLMCKICWKDYIHLHVISFSDRHLTHL